MSSVTRKLGKSDIHVSPLGLGGWAIGGPYHRNGEPMGWGAVDDRESIRAIHAAIEHGVNLFDTADLYGCGHSERLLGQAMQGRRQELVIASKFGYRIDEASKKVVGCIDLPAEIGAALQASLRRLGTDYIDLYQLHIANCPKDQAADVQAALEDLVTAGRIRAYGWSTDDPDCVAMFKPSKYFVAMQHAFNVLQGNEAMLAAVERNGLTSLCRGPLAMGLLTDKWRERDTVPPDDLRSSWDQAAGTVPLMLQMVAEIREILIQDGRSLPQGALGWLWARSDAAIPIPGFRSEAQVIENATAIEKGPLGREQMAAIEKIVSRTFPANPWDLRDGSANA